jgi:hypothetical protein
MAAQLPAGADPDNFEPALNVSAGDKFFLAFDNYSSQIDNYPITFFGTASLTCGTFIWEPGAEGSVSIYPNPANGVFTIEAKGGDHCFQYARARGRQEQSRYSARWILQIILPEYIL